MINRTLELSRALSLSLTFRPVTRGPNDPCARLERDQFLWAARNHEGPVAMRLVVVDETLKACAWGKGAEWQLARLSEFVGEHQADHEFTTSHSLVRDLHRRLVGLRIPRTRAVFASILPTVIEQRVTGMEAKHAYRHLVLDHGEPAPGPLGLFLPPAPQKLASLPYWIFHKYGIERKRADTIRRVASVAAHLESCIDMPFSRALQRLRAIAGIGPWTAGTVATTALGDPDAVIAGDYHIPNTIAWALAGEARGNDARMLELLEPFTGQRALVTRLLIAGVGSAPRYGPRYNPLRIAAY